ncbi:MAG: rhodanese-like domain-containing protein, partial [Actinomycetota bacterium]|nr:rhodanese-like domain-containing protein [Actinomycetota bacterium]
MAPETTEQYAVREITPQEAFAELQEGDARLIDTREPHEYAEVRIEGSKLIPPAMVADQIAEAVPDKSTRVIIHCRSGVRSATAAEQLAALGYEDVVSVAGGILDWQEQGLPT